MWGYSEHPRSIKKMGALKAPKVSKIERIVCWCHFTRLPKLDKVSFFKIFKVIKNKAEKTPFLFRIAPPHPTLKMYKNGQFSVAKKEKND